LGIEALVRQYTKAPIFRSRVKIQGWRCATTPGAESPLRIDARSAAFCGLANPQTFWRSLAETGVNPDLCWAFADHHQYRYAQLRRMARHAKAARVEQLLTTEKDVMNLPAGFEESLDGLPLYWLEIGIEVEREEELISLLQRECEKTTTG
jgi:tetraacyldisaccharide 4'-kinase